MKIERIVNLATKIFSNKDEIIVVYLYGSFLQSPFYNDIDIGLVIKKNFKCDLFYDDLFYEIDLARQFEKELKVEIDLRILNQMPLRFLFSVLKNSKLLFCRDDRKRIEFEETIMKEYLDIKIHHERYEKIRGLRYIIG